MKRAVQPALHQKNWMPLVQDDELHFVYSTDPTELLAFDRDSHACRVERSHTPARCLDDLRGGSQVVRVPDGWLYVAHQAIVQPDGTRHYLHRFVLLDERFDVASVSEPFSLLERGIEFCAGLARDPERGRLVVSFGVADARA